MGTRAGLLVDPMPENISQSFFQLVTSLTELSRERNSVSEVKSVACE
jgi:hypothetical protein